MGTNTGIGIGIGIPFKNNVLGEGKPYLPPEIKDSLKAVVIAYGKTNNDSDRAIVKNLVDASNPFIISNAAYKLNSGYGKYEEDFTSWNSSSYVSNIRHDSFDVNKDGTSVFVLYKNIDSSSSDTPSFKIKVSNLINSIIYAYINDSGVRSFFNIKENGEYILPKSYNSLTPTTTWIGFRQEPDVNCECTITQIPSFEGAFVTDGVNDLINSTKTVQEMLGGSNEITVVSMMANLDSRQILCNSNYNNTNGYNVRNTLEPNGVISMLGYTDKNGTTNNLNLIMGDKDSIKLVDKVNFNSDYVFYPAQYYGSYYQVAWYWTIIANKVLTTDEINQVIAYFNLAKTLKPDILCNTIKQGITNDNHAEFGDKLIDFSGNGRDIQLNNIAWDGDSGIGKYNYPNWKVNVTQGNKYARIVYYDSINGTYSANFKGITDLYKSYGLSIEIRVNRANTIDFHSIKEDGIYTMTPPDDTTSIDIRFGGENVYNASCDITITQIPSHAGGLCLDGVNDFGKVTGMPIYKDYTIIADYERFYLEPITGGRASILSKSSKVGDGSFIFNLEDQDGGKACYTFGEANGNISDDITRIIRYQSKYYNTKALSIGTAEDNDFMVLGKVREVDNRYFYGAIYSLMSFPYSMSEFLIERQLKKHKLGTLYPDMVEFRPIIKSNIDILKINYWDKDWNVVNVGDYVSVGNDIKTNITVPNGYKVSKVTSDAFDNITIGKSSTDFIYDVKFYGIKKSPQKIGITIEQDENYVKFEPVITSNVEYVRLDFYLNNYQKRINIGDYIPKDAYLRANFYLKNNVDELTVFTFNGVNIGYRRSSVDDTAFNINQIYNYDSPQEVNITIDEYIRYEDIVQPYPVLLRFKDENDNEVSWGGKFKVGSTITRIGSAADSNLLPNIYNIFGLLLNGNQVTSSKVIVEKTMVFKAKSAYIFDNNEPKCILSPRLLRIPNSSYKILGYIPDISGHGNNGVINNSAYAEGSGVNEDGSYQFDGVDDFVTIPTTVGGKQVLMKVNWQKEDTMIYNQNPGEDNFAIYANDYNNNNLVVAYASRNNGNTYIDGVVNNNILATQLKGITHNIVATNNNIDATITPIIGSNKNHDNFFAQMSLYDFMLFDEISTEDKIKELNTYIGITPKVTLPNYYWDNYGKKNTDAKRGYIDEQVSLQKTGTSVNPLENFNIGYEGMSGYNGYPVVLGANKTWETSNAVDYIYDINSTIVHITNVKHAANGLLYSYVKREGALANIKEIPAFRVTVKGLEENSKLIYKYLATENATKESIVYLGNGIHKLPKSFVPTDALLDLTTNSWIGFAITPMIEGELVFDCDITIEILPEYENGLVYDGVSDFTDNKNIPIFTDFTAIIKRVDLDAKNDNSTIMFKGNKIYESSIGNGFILDYCYNSKNYVYSYGKLNQIERDDSKIIYLTPKSYNGNPIIKGENRDNLGLVLGKYWKGIIYKTILYSKTISLLEINFLKNLMEKDEIIDINHPIFISNTEDESNASQDT